MKLGGGGGGGDRRVSFPNQRGEVWPEWCGFSDTGSKMLHMT